MTVKDLMLSTGVPNNIEKKGWGLQSMVERINLLEGNIDIRSRPHKGTGIFINIPIKEQADAK